MAVDAVDVGFDPVGLPCHCYGAPTDLVWAGGAVSVHVGYRCQACGATWPRCDEGRKRLEAAQYERAQQAARTGAPGEAEAARLGSGKWARPQAPETQGIPN